MTPAFLPSRGNASRNMEGQQMIPDLIQEVETVGESRGSQLQEREQGLLKHTTQPAQPVQPVTACFRVLLIDEHEIVRKGLSALFAEQDDFDVVGETASGNTAVAMAIQLQPDIILLDIMLKGANGLDIAQQLQRACPKGRIVIFTGLSDEMHLFRAMRIGVQGYLQKGLSLKQILEALRAIYRGERVIGEQHAITQVLNEFSRLTKEQERARSGLTDIEIELIRLAAQGCSNKEIASRQFWSEVTVKRKMQDIYRKLQVADRAQAVAEAMRMGLI